MRAVSNEFANLAANPEHVAVIAAHRNWLPKTDLPPAPGSTSRILTYDTKTNEAVWENRTVKRGDPIPG